MDTVHGVDGMTPLRCPWIRPLPSSVMVRRTSRHKKREATRLDGSVSSFRRERTPDCARTVAGRRSWWLAIAVVAGLLAMHGFGLHGAHSAETSSAMHSESISTSPRMSTTPVSAPEIQGARHSVATMTGLLSVGTTDLGPPDDGATDPFSGAGLAGLCVALLALSALWLRRHPGVRPAWTVPRRTLAASLNHLAVTARDLSPPLRAELSIWRC